ncbi:hypothetical protein L1049_020117 [Liquidambar formosana]|uniref:Uncharacterized protein n=1 Tax=Liquidambar formosana TaxID=63359 RepID=A0AAP0S6P1_LIQFO
MVKIWLNFLPLLDGIPSLIKGTPTLLLRPGNDTLIWGLKADGPFSTKSAYAALDDGSSLGLVEPLAGTFHSSHTISSIAQGSRTITGGSRTISGITQGSRTILGSSHTIAAPVDLLTSFAQHQHLSSSHITTRASSLSIASTSLFPRIASLSISTPIASSLSSSFSRSFVCWFSFVHWKKSGAQHTAAIAPSTDGRPDPSLAIIAEDLQKLFGSSQPNALSIIPSIGSSSPPSDSFVTRIAAFSKAFNNDPACEF